MAIQYESHQQHQIDAVNSVADVFVGQYSDDEQAEQAASGSLFSVVANSLSLSEQELLKNLNAVQRRNGLPADRELLYPDGSDVTQGRYLNLSVEMETGTGKTYAYTRTCLELNRRFGFKKYVIVVPSIAIKEGVLENFRSTRAHFAQLFDNEPYHVTNYERSNLSGVRAFATSQTVEFMVMTLDAFNRDANVIRRATEKLAGETPLDLIRAARPILILDEPQNMGSARSVAALASLNPMAALRYSATHTVPYNMVYRLTPFDAYRQGLVKFIEVDAVTRENDLGRPFLRLDGIRTDKNQLKASIAVHRRSPSGGSVEKVLQVSLGGDLEKQTSRPEYSGFIVEEIDSRSGQVRFLNGQVLSPGQPIEDDREEIWRVQIYRTLKEHMRKQARFLDQGIKVLSLFFIERVADYTGDDAVLPRLFDEAFLALREEFPYWRDLEPSDVREAYFAEKRKKSGTEFLDSNGESREDQAAFDLIMRGKESLLTLPRSGDSPRDSRRHQVSFIFSHSALREGWDNPNIFQVCTLSHSRSLMRKRQEIGRGVRLAVNQEGLRVRDEKVNILTVIANESYDSYVRTLQREIADDFRPEIEQAYGKPIGQLSDAERLEIAEAYGEGVLPPPPRRSGSGNSRLDVGVVQGDEFSDLWMRISKQTHYRVRVDTDRLVRGVVESLEEVEVRPPSVTAAKAMVVLTDGGKLEAIQTGMKTTSPSPRSATVGPGDGIEHVCRILERSTPPIRVTRRTVFRILETASSAGLDILANPPQAFDLVATAIQTQLSRQMVAGIEYEPTGGEYRVERLLADREVEVFSKHSMQSGSGKSAYSIVPCDSQTEVDFAEGLEAREDVAAYIKLPRWFVVPTPVGQYNPDWAIVTRAERGMRTHLVVETKGKALKDLAPDEYAKVRCGAAHFGSRQFKTVGALSGVDYIVTDNPDDLAQREIPVGDNVD